MREREDILGALSSNRGFDGVWGSSLSVEACPSAFRSFHFKPTNRKAALLVITITCRGGGVTVVNTRQLTKARAIWTSE
jgi:hypothetical protein